MARKVIAREVYEAKLENAKRVLLSKKVIALDGSGQVDVEALFTLIRWLEKEELRIVEPQENFKIVEAIENKKEV